MATNGGNFNEDEFLDLEPVLDDDSFSFELDPPDLEDIAVDSLVASAGEDYPEEKISDIDLDLDLDLDIEDPLLDEKINEIVDEDSNSALETTPIDFDTKDDFVFDDLEVDNEPITLSLDELDNITGEIETAEPIDSGVLEVSGDSFDEFGFDDTDSGDLRDDRSLTSDNGSSNDSDEESSFTDEELDEILGTDIFEEEEVDFSDEPIALSMDELNNIMSDEEVPVQDSDSIVDDLDLDMDSPPSEEISEDLNLEDIELATSPIDNEDWEDVEFDPEMIEPAQESEAKDIFGDEDIADEPITLSMEELSAITGEESSSSTEDSQDDDSHEEDIFGDLPEPDDSVDFEEFTLGDDDISSEDTNLLTESNDEDENLTLSDEELGNILGTEEELPSSGTDDLESIFDSEDEIALMPEENEDSGFGNILGDHDLSDDMSVQFGEVDDLTSEDDGSDLDSGIVVDLEEDLADEPITLSSDELNEIIGEVPPGEDLEEQTAIVMDTPASPSLNTINTDDVEVIDLDEFADEGGMSPLEELRQSPTPQEEDKSTEASSQDSSMDDSGLSPEDKKKVLTYLDNLLGNLPDDLIREFSKSNYFDLYKKMMKEIGL